MNEVKCQKRGKKDTDVKNGEVKQLFPNIRTLCNHLIRRRNRRGIDGMAQWVVCGVQA